VYNITPNPAQNQALIQIESNKPQEASIMVCNSFGEKVFEDKEHLQQGKNSYILNTSNFSNGMYMLHIQMASNSSVKRLIVSK
jgi:hypothetical protein